MPFLPPGGGQGPIPIPLVWTATRRSGMVRTQTRTGIEVAEPKKL